MASAQSRRQRAGLIKRFGEPGWEGAEDTAGSIGKSIVGEASSWLIPGNPVKAAVVWGPRECICSAQIAGYGPKRSGRGANTEANRQKIEDENEDPYGPGSANKQETKNVQTQASTWKLSAGRHDHDNP